MSIPGDCDDHSQYSDGRQYVLHGQHVLIIHRQGDEHGQNRTREESHVLRHNRQQRRNKHVHVLSGGFVSAAQPALQLVIQLVEVSQVQATIQRPPARPQTARFPFDDFGVAEKRVQHLPHQHERTQQEIDETG